MHKVTLCLISLLFATVFTGWAKAPSCVMQDDVNQWVITDTAYTEVIGYVINRADSMKVSGHSFVGPGPVSITFSCVMAKQPSYCCWELAADNKFEEILDQFRILDTGGTTSQFEYEFDVSGTYFMRFVADFTSESGNDSKDADNYQFSYTTKTPYQIQITESLLDVPNLITPDQPDSKNSIFRVKYKSLVSYEIWIHNRWGQELFHSNNPEEGWDGRYNGKTVPTGAYYYLIKAEGTDDIKYTKKGALNVLRTRENTSLNH